MSVPGPVLGPCESWIDGADVLNACAQAGVGSDSSLLDDVAMEASMALFEVSGRQFTGLCTTTARPARDGCGCWGPDSLGTGPWFWSTYPSWGVGAWGWKNECGDRLGCEPMSKVRLSGYPVREIEEVKIDGVVLPALDVNGNPNYRLDLWRELIRCNDPVPPGATRTWPSCQDMTLADTQPGTFSVRYRHGVGPPPLGMRAAAQLACQLWLAGNGEKCQLPVGTSRVTRSGITVDRGLLVNWFDRSKATGLVDLDLFLASYWRDRAVRRSAVFSPDVQPYARRMT